MVLLRAKFDRYVSARVRQESLEDLDKTWVSVTRQVNLCRDRKDNMILEVALNGNADLIVSGDQDLLSLNPFGEIAIVSPAAYLAMLE